MHLIKLIVFLLVGAIQDIRARSLSLSVNFSVALSDGQDNRVLSADMLRSCMKDTEISMAELSRFHASLLLNEPDLVNGIQDSNDYKEVKNVDYDGTSPIVEERNEESLQCFAHCLYEKLGLIKDGVIMDIDFLRKFYTVIEHEKQPVRECMNLESSNNCESAYKLHLCYNKLKNLEAERRIREILEYNDNENHDLYDGNDGTNTTTTDLPDFDDVEPKQNEIEKNNIN